MVATSPRRGPRAAAVRMRAAAAHTRSGRGPRASAACAERPQTSSAPAFGAPPPPSSSHARAVHGEADLAPSLLPSRRAAPAPSAGEGGEAARRAAVPPPLPPPALVPPPPIPAAVAPASARAWAARSVDGADGRAWAACGLAAAAAPLLRLELVSPRPCPAAAPAHRGGDSTPSPLSLEAGRRKLEQGRRRWRPAAGQPSRGLACGSSSGP